MGERAPIAEPEIDQTLSQRERPDQVDLFIGHIHHFCLAATEETANQVMTVQYFGDEFCRNI